MTCRTCLGWRRGADWERRFSSLLPDRREVVAGPFVRGLAVAAKHDPQTRMRGIELGDGGTAERRRIAALPFRAAESLRTGPRRRTRGARGLRSSRRRWWSVGSTPNSARRFACVLRSTNATGSSAVQERIVANREAAPLGLSPGKAPGIALVAGDTNRVVMRLPSRDEPRARATLRHAALGHPVICSYCFSGRFLYDLTVNRKSHRL